MPALTRPRQQKIKLGEIKLICAGVAAYFLAAYYAKISYVDTAPKAKDAAQVIGPYRLINGFRVARVWIAAKDSPVTIYENGVSLGRAHDTYKDPDEKFTVGGKRWEYVEFYSAGDPNTNGRHYWAVKTQ
jgi:hypothetical protein